MYLKSIEIQGFKSFANKTVLDFSKGITAIVGPNGSGKSNISDAVRWVLGEQKVKQLRGATMQDVIFAGTEKRRPQSFAYVAITLDNSDRKLPLDYDEVKVSRRLYRSGESEYLLNGTECRLKDINEIFYDTGIGKEGYSIIGQGQIDQILSGRPEDRRALFDEAVGINKYKRRKTLSEAKLASEQENLARVTDILKELERQVEPLLKQSEQAKKYLAFRDRLVIYESNLFLRDMEETTKQMDSVSENADTVNADLRSVRSQSAELTNKYDETEKKIREAEERLNTAQKEVNSSDLLKTNLEGQINVLSEQINTEKNNALHYNQRINALKKDQFDTISRIEDGLAVLKWINEQLDFIQSSGSSVNHENVELDMDLIKSAVSETMTTVANCMGNDFQLEERDISTVEKEGNRNENLLSGIEDRRKELSQIDLELESLKEEIREQTERQVSLKQMINASMDKYNHAIQGRDNTRNRLETLQNLAERYEGYGRAVQAVMDQRDREHGIEGVVSDLIEVPKEYETAVETALGGAVQNIVTSDELTAKRMVQFLKQNRAGRATFLPLTNIRGRRDETCLKAAAEPGAIGLGCDLIQYKPSYQVLAEYLLGRVLVADTLDNALKIARKYHQSIRIVTLEGDLLNPGGAISGGAYRNSSNLMGRKRELDELENTILSFEDSIEKLKKIIAGQKEKEVSLEMAVSEAQTRLQKLELDRNTKAMSISSALNSEYSALSTRTDYLTENLHSLSEQLERIFTEKSELEDDAANSDQVLKEKNDKINGLRELIDNAEKVRSEKQEEIRISQEDKERLLSERSSLFSEKDELSQRLVEMEKESVRVQNRKEKLDQKLESLTSYMLEEYNLTYQEAKEKYRDDLGNTGELRGSVTKLKQDMKALGSVNLDSIEQYKEVSERYEFLKKQYDDLTESEKSLSKVIEELDRGMREQFNKNFSLIQVKFDEVFRVLFGGGHGRIELDTTDETDVLTSGISIIAEPPGKKLQNMMQLSGGEKALTAISLLFAIQALKPSPFCLLDEIEAALDDSNVARFADYLHNLMETQFIVITHRRGTMERADRLFGITMQEKGVSALVSVDLVQDQLDA